ncbi:hypothetical protein OAX71_02170 [Pseudomonadales bacterium]|nr:hypothetical protein [Pseudomonadales bacterium]
MTMPYLQRQQALLRYLLAFTTALILAAPAQAQPKTEDELAIMGAMHAMDEFLLAFNQRDAAGWAASLNYPHVRFASGTVTVWNSAADFSDTDAFEMLSKSGWDHSHWLTRDVVLVSPQKVHIATVFQRFNKRNEIIGTYQSLYVVTKKDGHWGTQARSSLAP